MERVAVDTATWQLLVTAASDLSRTVQASLDKLALLMTPAGYVRSAVTKLRLLTARSKATVCDHLGQAQASGWLTCVERGGHRADGSATTAAYQATVPREVWERREEYLASLPAENPDPALVKFAPGDVVPGQPLSETRSSFRPPLIDPSPQSPSSENQTSPSSPAPDPHDPDWVINGVIEELEAHSGVRVTRPWAVRIVSQVIGRRRVKYPRNYVTRSIQNAAHDGTLTVRFLPAGATTQPATADQAPAQPAAEAPEPTVPAGKADRLGAAPWDLAPVGFGDQAEFEVEQLFERVLTPKPKPPVQPPLMSTVPTTDPEPTKAERLASQATDQNIYRPELRIAGLGTKGAAALAAERERQEAERRSRAEQATGRSRSHRWERTG